MIHQNSERKSNGRAATTAMVGKRDDVHMRRCCNLAANRADGAVCEGVPVMVEDGGRGDRWAGAEEEAARSPRNCIKPSAPPPHRLSKQKKFASSARGGPFTALI